MALYKKKPVTVSAIQWTGKNKREISNFLTSDNKRFFDFDADRLFIKTLKGRMSADVGDYIIKGVEGEFYPCKSSIFMKTYDKNEEEKVRVLKQYDEKGDLKNYWIPGEMNPCGCGSNLFYRIYDGNNILCVCNSCKTVIYTIKDKNKEEELNTGIWVYETDSHILYLTTKERVEEFFKEKKDNNKCNK